MSEYIPLSTTINRLTDNKKLRKNIHTRYQSAAKTHGWHCSLWNGQINANNLHVKDKEFYEWIKKHHPELIPMLPPEHQKVWKEYTSYFVFSCGAIGVYDPPKPPNTLEQAHVVIAELMNEIRRLEKLVGEKQKTINELKPDADRRKEVRMMNKKNGGIRYKYNY
jgi:hypothetical protein